MCLKKAPKAIFAHAKNKTGACEAPEFALRIATPYPHNVYFFFTECRKDKLSFS